ncbi:hypothetical protein HMPREF2910_01405 [Staphylococcus sp. HMSC066C03]|nr:hypothetical protein HMPREF2910_01405 [Staphylococcus sp. HMSC066C03]
MRLLVLLNDTIRHNQPKIQIQQELRKLGVKGFVVKVAGSRVTMKVEKENIRKNRECMRNGRSN